MPLETATYISDLNVANPAHSDGLSQADSHMRLLKSTLKNTFPNFTAAALTSTNAQIDAAVASTTGAGYTRIPLGTAALPGLTPVGDPNTGIFSPAADQLAVSLNGTQVMLMGSTALVTTLGVTAASLSGPGMSPIGSIIMWPSDTLPPAPAEGTWYWCNGTAFSRTIYPTCFARLGTTWGAGDGSTTFNLPNFQEVSLVGKSTMGGASSPGLLTSISSGLKGVLNGLFGADTVTLAATQIPVISSAQNAGFNVSVSGSTGSVVTTAGSASVAAGGNAIGTAGSTGTTSVTASGTVAAGNVTSTSNNTGGLAHTNVQPSRAVNYIIRLA